MADRRTSRAEAAQTLVRQEVDRNGPMRFDRFVDIALYHPVHGYYNRGAGQRGRGGDYFTSMQVSDLFPRIFVAFIKAMRETMGAEQFSLIELGSGGGEFLEGVLKAMTPDERKGLRVWAVERSRPARENLWKRLSRFPKCEAVGSLDEIEWMGGLEGLVLSNEFFDALPFRRLKRTAAGWNEISVGVVDGVLADVEAPLADPAILGPCGLDTLDIEPGIEVEARPGVAEIYGDIGARLTRGWTMSVDYGHAGATIGLPNAPRGTWRCFHEHAMNETPYAHVGHQDITASVDFSQLEREGRAVDFDTQLFCSQGQFLAHAGRVVIEKSLAGPDQAMVARAVQQLIHPDAMGERFQVLLQGRSVERPALLADIHDRSRRLTKV